MNDLKLVKSAMFGEVQADFYGKDSDVFMTAEQLGECLGYSQPKAGISKMLKKFNYLKDSQFSTVTKMVTVDGKEREVRIFNEDGIYEITFLSKTEKAKEFRAWVRKTLKSLRKGNTKLVSMSEYQKMIVQTRQENVKVRKANLWLKLATNYDGAYRQVLESYATKELTGDHIIPLPAIGKKTYSATDIANILETTPNKIGILSNRHNLKTNEYGEWFYDNAKHCKGKQVTSFRYYDNAIPILRQLLTD